MTQSLGTRRVPFRPISSIAYSSTGTTYPARLQTGWARLRRDRSLLWLRLSLFLTQRQWLKRSSLAVIGGFDRIGRAIENLCWRAITAAFRAIKWHRAALVATEPFVLPLEWRAALVRIMAYLGAIAVMSVVAAEIVKQPDVAVVQEPASRPAWIDVDKPWPAFEISVPGITDDMHYAIQRHAEGGGRKDRLSFGELGKTPRYASFEIYRAGLEIEQFGDPDDEIAGRGSEYGRIVDMKEAMPIPSKFGTFQVNDFGVRPFGAYRCIGFSRVFEEQRVKISGMACNQSTIVDRSTMSCALDRLTLVSGGSDPDIARLFAQAELKRTFCGQRDPLMYATPRRVSSDITSSAKPKLRGRLVR